MMTQNSGLNINRIKCECDNIEGKPDIDALIKIIVQDTRD